MTDIAELVDMLAALPSDKRKLIEDEAAKATAAMPWCPNPGAQMEAYMSLADETGFGGEAGPGKLLPLDTPLPTPSGWTTMGEVRPGDLLIDQHGAPCMVTFKSPVQVETTYRLTFSDGAQIVAGARHQWVTSDYVERGRAWRCTDESRALRRATRPKRGTGKRPDLAIRNADLAKSKGLPSFSVRTTQEIVDTLRVRGRANHSIPVAGAMQLPDADLLIEPYVLGAWLGDGTSSAGSITGIDEEIFAQVANGYQISMRKDPISRGILGLQKHLRQLGLLGNKHIPSAYLRASIEQRQALLQGLMDTDGFCDKRDGSCVFTTTRRVLADGVYELLLSLGVKTTIQEGMAKLYGREIGPKYNLCFLADFPAFRLSRKLIAQKRSGFRGPHALRYIVDAVEVDPVPMQCVQVDSQTRTYLCGLAMIPTHNTDLICGLALTKHKRSLILRRTNNEARKLIDRFVEIVGHRSGLNSSDGRWRLGNRLLDVGGCEHEDDKQKRKGNPYDLIAFDEVVDFSRSQYEFIIQWNRSTDEGQRCRVVCTFNPPTKPVGLWVIERFAPWLDPKHPRPAKSGEIRWFTVVDGKDTEVDGPGPHVIPGEPKPVMAKSRTFIRGHLEENVALARTGYDATRAAAPKGMREAYRDGNFEASLADVPNQCIPTAWVRMAQQRWTPKPPPNIPMCAMAADASGGGDDPLVICWRHDGWFAPLVEVPGKNLPIDRMGAFSAGVVVSYRRDDADVIVDLGGGYGGPLYEKLHENGITAQGYKGAEKTTRRTRDKKLGFVNKRTAAYWGLREALDPDQPGGSPIALPPDDSKLVADLTSPTFEVTSRGIELESKESVCERLGRSTDHGDAAVMVWWCGPTAKIAALDWIHRGEMSEQGIIPGAYNKMPRVITSREHRGIGRR